MQTKRKLLIVGLFFTSVSVQRVSQAIAEGQ